MRGEMPVGVLDARVRLDERKTVQSQATTTGYEAGTSGYASALSRGDCSLGGNVDRNVVRLISSAPPQR